MCWKQIFQRQRKKETERKRDTRRYTEINTIPYTLEREHWYRRPETKKEINREIQRNIKNAYL